MAACALATARVRDGALITPQGRRPDLLRIPPEDFFAAAEDALPPNLLEVYDFNYVRGCALMALASIQDGRIDHMRKYLGHYFTIMAIRQWHYEANWPAELSPVEKEERRRLYWSIYTLDIYTAIVWNGAFHFQEAHSRVEYPRGTTSSQSSDTDWIIGWNFTTDLYRILEHAVTRLRTRHSKFNLFADGVPSGPINNSAILKKVDSLYSALPPSFKELKPAIGNLDTDIYGFQAANIQATLALLRMVFLSLEGDADLEKKCAVASDVLETFHHVPKAFQRAISTPLIYHIASIGNILGSVMEGPLSEASYQRVRGVLVSMASLLESLEDFLSRRAGAGRSLRDLVGAIDGYMESRRGIGQDSQVPIRLAGPEVTGIEAGGIDEFSDLFQIPDELLQDWNWSSMLLSDVQHPLV
ncbi:related to C6 transcription factor [Cephalotrichum gorgonifer]|uniref:Related to C6 transcription factor n=1 Tax=Cephalotrichum gorgonifer TaxID=2041049 RepID=A0AAE8SYS0_9PEZI|nr:related to C6 transcription factor [Cephalotrichum gorgonifer]